MTLAAPSEVDALVGRQPIFDRELELVGYELLYRHAADAAAAHGADAVTMTNTTMANGMLAIGLDDLVGEAEAWVNIPQETLETDMWTVLDPTRCVLELTEDIVPTPEAQAAVARADAAGFRIALDDYVIGGPTAPLLPAASIVKVIIAADRGAFTAAARQLRTRRDLILVAECIESARDLKYARDLGFDCFQGWHFGRAETVVGREFPPQLAAVASAMRRIRESESTDREVELGFQADPSLMIKLLKIANNAAYGVNGVESAQRALQLVGREVLYRWLAILLVASIPRHSGVDEERLRTALETARFCELIGERVRGALDPSTCFLAGLVSKLDALLGMSLEEAVEKVRVTAEVREALLHGEGTMAPVLRLAHSVELAQFPDAQHSAEMLGIGPELGAMAAEAIQWSRQMRASLA